MKEKDEEENGQGCGTWVLALVVILAVVFILSPYIFMNMVWALHEWLDIPQITYRDSVVFTAGVFYFTILLKTLAANIKVNRK